MPPRIAPEMSDSGADPGVILHISPGCERCFFTRVGPSVHGYGPGAVWARQGWPGAVAGPHGRVWAESGGGGHLGAGLPVRGPAGGDRGGACRYAFGRGREYGAAAVQSAAG